MLLKWTRIAGTTASMYSLLNTVIWVFLLLLPKAISTQPKCISSYNITRDISFQYPQGVSHHAVLNTRYIILITLDSIPTDCNLLLTGVSVTTLKSCNVTLELLDKIGNSTGGFSKRITLTQEQQISLPKDMIQVDFDVADKYHVNQTLYMALTISPQPSCTVIVKEGELSHSLTVAKEMLTEDVEVAVTPIVTYRFGASDPCGNESDTCTLQEFVCLDCDKGGRRWPCRRRAMPEVKALPAASQKTSSSVSSTPAFTSQNRYSPTAMAEATTGYGMPNGTESSTNGSCSKSSCNDRLAAGLTGGAIIVVHAVVLIILVAGGCVKFTCSRGSRSGQLSLKSADIQYKEKIRIGSNRQLITEPGTSSPVVSTTYNEVALVATDKSRSSVRSNRSATEPTVPSTCAPPLLDEYSLPADVILKGDGSLHTANQSPFTSSTRRQGCYEEPSDFLPKPSHGLSFDTQKISAESSVMQSQTNSQTVTTEEQAMGGDLQIGSGEGGNNKTAIESCNGRDSYATVMLPKARVSAAAQTAPGSHDDNKQDAGYTELTEETKTSTELRMYTSLQEH